MSWFLSFVIALLTGLAGMLVSGILASRAVEWHRISSFEGGSGYFVVGLALVGLLGGAVIGLVTARVMAASDPTFLRVLGSATAAVVLLAGSVGGISRLLADIPPTIAGEELQVAFELRWPDGQEQRPSSTDTLGFARLGAGAGQSVRTWVDGVLFVEDARQVEGRWVIPGLVPLFTARGDRILDIGFGDSSLAGFLVPLPRRPQATDLEWSDWLPRASAAASADMFTYRYRVVPVSGVVRTQRIGEFDIATIVSNLYRTSNSPETAAFSSFRIHYRGAPVAGLDTVGAIAVVAADRPALVVKSGDANSVAPCHLLTANGDGTSLSPVGDCGPSISGALLTGDANSWHASRRDRPAAGWLDRRTFRRPGLYRIDSGILDTRSLTYTALKLVDAPAAINGLPPIALSPDEASFAWFTHGDDEQAPMLAVTTWRTGTTYTVPIDRSRMRYNDHVAIDPAWVAHHFDWQRQGDSGMRLVQRTDFAPLPYRGDREIDGEGMMSSYYLRPAGTALRNAIIDAMVSDLGAERLPDELNGYHRVVRFEGKLVKGAVVESGGFVSIGMDYGSVDSEVMQRLADRLDALIATGRFDALFHVDAAPASEP